MELKKTAVAGTMESSDIMVTITPSSSGGIEIELNSPVEKEFGYEIRNVISETLKELGVFNAKITAVDKGALDCVIRARVETAVYRASSEKKYIWEGAQK